MAVTTSLSESNFSRYISILTKPSLFTAVQYLSRRSARESILFTLLFAMNSSKYCVIDFDVLGNYFSSTYFKSLHSMMFNDFISIDCFYQRSDVQQLLVLYALMRAQPFLLSLNYKFNNQIEPQISFRLLHRALLNLGCSLVVA